MEAHARRKETGAETPDSEGSGGSESGTASVAGLSSSRTSRTPNKAQASRRRNDRESDREEEKPAVEGGLAEGKTKPRNQKTSDNLAHTMVAGSAQAIRRLDEGRGVSASLDAYGGGRGQRLAISDSGSGS